MVERILELLKEKKLSPSQFADEIGIQRSGMSHLISGRNKPSLEVIIKVLKRFPDVQADWLLFGTPGSEKNIHVENELLPEAKPSLFNELLQTEEKNLTKPPVISRKEKTGSRVEKIVVFYDNKTFREYEPER